MTLRTSGSRAVLLCAFLGLAIVQNTGHADTKEAPVHSDNPNDTGFRYGKTGSMQPLAWKEYATSYPACVPLVASYNQVMHALFRARWHVARLREMMREVRHEMKQARGYYESGRKTKEALGEAGERMLAHEINYRGGVTDLNEKLRPELEQLAARLESQAAALLQQIQACEAALGAKKKDGMAIISHASNQPPPPVKLPFEWKGPYPEVCASCIRLARWLNDLPAIAYRVMGELAAAQARKQLAEAESTIIRTLDVRFGDSKAEAAYDREKRKRLEKLQDEIDQQVEKMDRARSNLDKVEQNFKETLKRYDDCVPTCESKRQACSFPGQADKAITIGPNSAFGTGAAVTEKAVGMAKGAAAQVLGGFFGGSGISLDDDDSGKEPQTVRDPTGEAGFVPVSAGATDMGFRGQYGDGELLVSATIFDSPSDGTFHAQWLEDVEGNRYRPTRYLIFGLYLDWKLTVWWTYDRWVDGQHVEHREGEEVSFGTEHLGDFALRFEGDEGVKHSIWHRNGFDTARKGIKALGTVYRVPQHVLAGPCPVRLVTHVSLPGEDPVVTQPVISYAGLDRESGTVRFAASPDLGTAPGAVKPARSDAGTTPSSTAEDEPEDADSLFY